MPTVLTEGAYPGDWLKWEEDNHFSREEITILAGSGAVRALKTGMVLGKVTKGAAAGAAGTNTGDGTITAVPVVQDGAKVGVYRLTCIEEGTNVGTFQIEDPDGITIGAAVVAVEYDGVLKFTIADGTADFVAGDQFTITVAAGSGKYVQFDEDGTDGSEDAAGVLLLDVTAPDGTDATGAIIARDAIVNTDHLTWPTTADAGEKAAGLLQLIALGILVREGA